MKLQPFEVDAMLAALYGERGDGHFAAQLTEWENDFVASIQGQWSRRRFLTDGQDAKLAQIWETFASGARRREAGA